MIADQARYNTEAFQQIIRSDTLLDWPENQADVFHYIPEQDTFALQPPFERHLRNLENYSLGARFAAMYPELVPYCIVDMSRGQHSSA